MLGGALYPGGTIGGAPYPGGMLGGAPYPDPAPSKPPNPLTFGLPPLPEFSTTF